ncbi:unnamed protein product [Enterobius vermicularis]|uniref:MFS domain-containing protein n=1 Tax=Enterobius vermicularis TaxID=51028 RepID=A0A158Q9H4_ENTVE|nr:unnamed protein product [Enterobius vermicularis]
MVSPAICILTTALCLSSGFQQGYIANVLNQPYVAIENFINASWIQRYGKPVEPNTLLEPETRKSSELESQYQNAYLQKLLPIDYLRVSELLTDRVLRIEAPQRKQYNLWWQVFQNVIWSSLNIVFPTAGILGQFLAAYLCRRFGRKKTAIISSFIYLPGVALSYLAKTFAPYFELLFVGRFIWSLANGILTVTATVWIVECVPTDERGRMASLQEVFMASGSLLCQTVGIPVSTDELWPDIFIPPLVVSVIATITFCFTYESPQYIIDYEKNIQKLIPSFKARNALTFYHGRKTTSAAIEEELKVCAENTVEKTQKKKEEKAGSSGNLSGLTVMFNPLKASDPKSKAIRTAAWLGVVVKIAYVFTGARCLRAYSTFVLHYMGKWELSKALFLSFVIGFLRVPFTFAPVLLVERVGRRPLIYGSMILSFFTQLLLMISVFAGESWKVGTFAGLSGLLLVNACGLGSISRFYSAELVPRSLLIDTVSILTAAEAITKVSVEFAFFPMAHIIGGSSILFFAIPTALLAFVTWYSCPETKGKPVNEVLEAIEKRQNTEEKLGIMVSKSVPS